jgi:voltage-gated potassium channel
MDKLEDVFDVRLMKRSLAITITLLLIGAGLIFLAEQRSEDITGVESFGQSVWWAFTTVVTGGYGDIHNPGTLAGRVITVLLVIAGMTVVGIFTATLTSVLVGDESERLLENQEVITEKLGRLESALEMLATNRGLSTTEKDES